MKINYSWNQLSLHLIKTLFVDTNKVYYVDSNQDLVLHDVDANTIEVLIPASILVSLRLV